MRPRGEIRCAVLNAAQVLFAKTGQGVTWKEPARQAGVGYAATRQVVRDMAKAGELERVGTRPVPGIKRPMNIYYAPRQKDATGQAALNALMSTWSRTWATDFAADPQPMQPVLPSPNDP